MTVYIEKANIRPEQVVKGFSRYLDSPVIYWGEQRRITFETYLRKPYTLTGKERVIKITPGLAYRPDLLAYDVYNTPDAWWKILEVNGIKDIYEFKTGRTIILPDNLI